MDAETFEEFMKQLTDEQRARYDYIKDVSMKAYPQIENNAVMMNLSNYLWMFYAKNGYLPDPPEGAVGLEKEASGSNIDPITSNIPFVE